MKPKTKIIILSMFAISSPIMLHIGAGLAGVDLTPFLWFIRWEITATVLLIVVEALVAFDAARLLIFIAHKKGKATREDNFVWWFQAIGLTYLAIVFAVAGTIAWIEMPTQYWLLFIWGVSIRICVPIAVAMHAMSVMLLPEEPSQTKPDKRLLNVLASNGTSHVQIAAENDLPVEDVAKIKEIQGRI